MTRLTIVICWTSLGWDVRKIRLEQRCSNINVYLEYGGWTEEGGVGEVRVQETLAGCLGVDQGVVVASSKHHVGQGGGGGVLGGQSSASTRGRDLEQNNLSEENKICRCEPGLSCAQLTKPIYIIVILLSTIIRVEIDSDPPFC